MVDGTEELSRISGLQLAQLYAREALLDLERRQRKRAKPPASFLEWCELALAERGLKPAKHHKLLIDELQGVADGETKRLMVFAPPGSGKSFYVTLLFPTYLFKRFSGFQIIGASHSASLAEDFSGKIQDLIRDHSEYLGYSLRTENKERWYTTNGGSYLAAGVGKGITGARASIAIIDDPIKSREAADSEAVQKHNWNWFNGVLERRCIPNAPVVLMHTRWSENDIAGMLLQTEAHKWRILILKAEAEDNNDPLGREPGEFLWCDDSYGYGASLREIRDTLETRGAIREWSSQYQQHPSPAEGIIFNIGRIIILPEAPSGGTFCRGWDLAATREIGARDPAWTRGVLLQRTDERNPRYIVHDVASVRGTPDDVEFLIRGTAQRDGRDVVIGLPQDPGQAGKSQILYLTRRLEGYIVRSSPESGDKIQRASPVASQCNVGNLFLMEGSWNQPFLAEIGAFPAGAHTDQADGLSRAFSELALGPREFSIDSSVLQGLRLGTLIQPIRRKSIRV